jgi:DNA-directed RNA polymerase specialized sigma24 family protein
VLRKSGCAGPRSGWPSTPEGPRKPDPVTSTALSSALMRLPIQQRRLLVLYYLADLPADEITGDAQAGPPIAW